MKTTMAKLAVASMGLVAPGLAAAGGFTPWGGATGDGVVALSPYFFVGGDGTTSVAPYLWVGKTDHFDILFGYSFSIDPNPDADTSPFSSGAIEIMPRGIINDSAVFGFHALYTPGDSSAVLGPEFHGVVGSDYFAFTYNVGWWFTAGGDPGFDAGDVFFILVPEFIVNERFSIFAEFNPNVYVGDPANAPAFAGGDPNRFSASVVPGLTFYLDKDLNHSLTAAAILSVAPEFDGATFGLLYFAAWDFGKKSAKMKRDRTQRQLASTAFGY